MPHHCVIFMVPVIRKIDCVDIYNHWLRTGQDILCKQICLPHEDAVKALLPWQFTGQGFIGTVFKHGQFSYSITGELARFHGQFVTASFLQFFYDSIATYHVHPLPLIPLFDAFNNTEHESTILAYITTQLTRSVYEFYKLMTLMDVATPVLYIQQSTPHQLEVDAIITKFGIQTVPGINTQLARIVRIPASVSVNVATVAANGVAAIEDACAKAASVVSIADVDAILLILFLPTLLKMPSNLRNLVYVL